MVDAIVVGFAEYAIYCGLIFMDKRHTAKSMKIYIAKISMHTVGAMPRC